MTLGDIKNHVFRRTKTNSNSWGTTFSDMAIAANAAQNKVDAKIRPWVIAYTHTAWTGSDISTGTPVPKFHSKFHELIPLWIEYQYAVENGLDSAAGIFQEYLALERDAELWYGQRNYKVVSVTIAAPGVVTLDNHGLKTNDKVIIETTGALPTGLAEATWYYVIYDTEHTFKLASTRDGSAITTTGTQSGTHFLGVEANARVKPLADSNK